MFPKCVLPFCMIINIYKNIRFHTSSVDKLCCNISESTTNARTPLFLCFSIQILDSREDWLGEWPHRCKKAITKTQIGWITGSVVWLNVSLNRLLVAMENLYWLSVSVNSSGGDRASLGFETVHLGSATRPRLAVHWLCISKGVVVLVHCHTFLHCILTICVALHSTWSPSAHCALFQIVLCISLLSIMHFTFCIV